MTSTIFSIFSSRAIPSKTAYGQVNKEVPVQISSLPTLSANPTAPKATWTGGWSCYHSSQCGQPKHGIADLRTSLIFPAFETTMLRDWRNRTQAGESLLESSFDTDSIIFVICLREYNDCRSRVGGGPAEKVTLAATFKHRVIFADTCDLSGSWRSICTSIDDLFRMVLKTVLVTICSLSFLGMSQKSRIASPIIWSDRTLACLQYNFNDNREDRFAVLESLNRYQKSLLGNNSGPTKWSSRPNHAAPFLPYIQKFCLLNHPTPIWHNKMIFGLCPWCGAGHEFPILEQLWPVNDSREKYDKLKPYPLLLRLRWHSSVGYTQPWSWSGWQIKTLLAQSPIVHRIRCLICGWSYCEHERIMLSNLHSKEVTSRFWDSNPAGFRKSVSYSINCIILQAYWISLTSIWIYQKFIRFPNKVVTRQVDEKEMAIG